MGMNYDITFEDAVIPPEQYGALIGWTPEEVEEESQSAAELALKTVSEMLDDYAEPTQSADGIDISGYGYHDSASYGYGEELYDLLAHCAPGASIHEHDGEGGSGEQWRHILTKSGKIVTIKPVLVWPEVVEA